MCITFTVVAMLKTAAYFAALAGDKRRLLPLLFLLLPLPFVVGASAAGCGCSFCCIKINIYARQLVQSSANAIVFIRQQRASTNASFCPLSPARKFRLATTASSARQAHKKYISLLRKVFNLTITRTHPTPPCRLFKLKTLAPLLCSITSPNPLVMRLIYVYKNAGQVANVINGILNGPTINISRLIYAGN